MKSILFVHNEVPSINHDLRAFKQIKELSKNYEVTLLTIRHTEYKDSAIKIIKKYCDIVFTPYSEKEIKAKNFLERRKFHIKKIYNKYSKFLKKESNMIKDHSWQVFFLRYKLNKLLTKKKFDYIQVEHYYLSHILYNLKTKAKKILDFHNVYSHMKSDFQEKILIKKDEIKISKHYDLAICCSNLDKKRLKNLGYKKVLVVPNSIYTNNFKMLQRNSKTISLLFVGQLNYPPNYKGIEYFFKKYHPLLNQNIKINIVGNYNKKLRFKKENKLKNVKFHGYVKNIKPYFKNSISICPLLDGGGTRQKILMSFALGSPVVSTTKGAEGIDYKDGKNILIADNPKEFSKAIKLLLENKKLYKKISENARKLVEDKYDSKKEIEKYFRYLEKMN